MPFADVRDNPAHLKVLEELDAELPARGAVRRATASSVPELKALAPEGEPADEREPARQRRPAPQGAQAPGLPQLRRTRWPPRGTTLHENTKPLGEFLRDVMRNNPTSFRVFGPDETASNRLQAIYEASKKTWMADMLPEDADGGELARDGRVMEMLSEHTLLGWLEGYLLTGRHGLFHTYEAFAHVIDSMVNQHAKWLDISKNHVQWRAPVASENILLSSTVWRQDHNGFSHQDPGFIDLVTNKSRLGHAHLPAAGRQHAAGGRRPLPAQHRLRQRHRRRQAEAPAVHHDRRGDRPLREGPRHLGAGEHRRRRGARRGPGLLRRRGHAGGAGGGRRSCASALPDLKLRFVNVVDLFKLQPASEHPHGSTEREFDGLFTTDKPIIFNFHGYPWLIHKLAYRFKGHENLHVHGYRERGNINTPFELAMLNETSRFHLVIDVIDRVPEAARRRPAHLKEEMKNAIIDNLALRARARHATAPRSPTGPGRTEPGRHARRRSSSLNAGSSSLKFSVFLDEDPPRLLLRGQIEGLSTRAALRRARRRRRGRRAGVAGRDPAGPRRRHRAPLRVGPKRRARRASHRGRRPPRRPRRHALLASRCSSTPTALAELEALVPLAPLHQPHNLAAIRAVARWRRRCRRSPASTRRFTATQPPRRAGLRAPPPLRRGGRPPLRLPRAVLRVHRLACCRQSTARRRRPHGRGPPRQRREHVRAGRRHERRHDDELHRARRPRRWARAAARSTPACCST